MPLPSWFDLATDAMFRELSNFITPPRAGKITSLEPNGQVRVDTDDPDGGDVLAWPLNGFTYAVDEVVYVTFAVNNPESALVVGSKGSLPALALAALATGVVRAASAAGLRLEDEGGNLGLEVEDGGGVLVGGFLKRSVNNADMAIVGAPEIADAAYATVFGVNHPTDGSRGNFDFVANSRNSTNGGSIRFYTYNGVSSWLLRMVINRLGDVAIGVSNPMGKFHVHDGTAGFLVVTKTGVNSGSQTIIPNGAGDVTRAAWVNFVIQQGSAAAANTFTLVQGGTMSVPITIGTGTWTVTLNANGQVSVARTSGSGNADINLVMQWI